jgi:hypothetical protein
MAEPCDIFLRNNNGKWLMVVNLEKSLILNEKLSNGQEDPENPVYLSEKKVYYIFFFSKLVSVNWSKKKPF